MMHESTRSPTAAGSDTATDPPTPTASGMPNHVSDGPAADWRAVLDDLLCAFEDEWSAVPQLSVEDFVAARLPPETGEVQRFVAVAELAQAEFELALAKKDDPRANEWLEKYEPLRALPGIAAELFVVEYQQRHQRMALPLAEFLRDVPHDLRDAVAARLTQHSRYTFVRQVGAGGQGEVWEGRDRELERPVAVKVLRANSRHFAEARQRLVLEARVTSQLEHPGVVPVYGLEEYSADGRPRYAMRYVRGETLTRRIRKYHELRCAGSARPAAERWGVSLPRPDRSAVAEAELRLKFRGLLVHFIAICKTVAFAHAHPQTFIHRDLKPDNVMVGEFGETIVMDWGLARPVSELACEPSGASRGPKTIPSAADTTADTAADSSSPTAHGAARIDLQSETTRIYDGAQPPDFAVWHGETAATGKPFRTHDGVLVGTPAYMSPEQAGADFPLGTHTDVFGLGAILHYILANRPPHQARPNELLNEVFRRIQSEPLPYVGTAAAGIPAPLAAICDKALAFAPRDRYASAAELAEEVERFLADEPVAAYSESIGERCLRVVRKYPGRVATAAGFAAVLAAMAMLLTWYVPYSRSRASRVAQVALLAEQEPDGARMIVTDLAADKSLGGYIESQLLAQLASAEQESPPPAKRLRRLRLALLPFPSGKANVQAVFDDLKTVDDLRELGLASALLEKFVAPSVREPHCLQLWDIVGRPETPSADRLKYACLLATLDAENPRWQEHAAAVTESLVSSPLHASGDAVALLKPVADHLEAPLRRVFDEVSQRHTPGQFAAEALATYYFQEAADHPTRVGDAIELLLRGTPAQQIAILDRIPPDLVPAVCGTLEQRLADAGTGPTAQAGGAAALLKLQPTKWDWSRLRHSPHPDVRTLLIHRIPQLRIPARVLSDRLVVESDGSIRQAILLSLGRYPRAELGSVDVQRTSSFVQAEDAGESSAAQWAVGSLDLPQRAKPGPTAPSTLHGRWWMNKNGHRMIALAAQPKGETFWMGALDHEKGYAAAAEPRYAARIDRPYAISATETTVAEMERFMKGYRRRHDADRKKADETRENDADQQSEPASFVPLFHALAYCNWLSRQDGIPKDQWCYAQDRLDDLLGDKKDDTFFPEDANDIAMKADLSKTGYRLPTEIEWEYACRAGAESSRFFGDSPELLGSYAHHRNNSPINTLSPVGRHMPNAWGLFDTLGNVAEWCYGGGPKTGAAEHVAPRCGLRGGSVNDEAVVVRSSYRILVPVNAAQRDIGFRVARTLHGE